MRSIRFTIAKNASANVIRGGASAVVAIVLPHFLTRSLGVDRFAGWALMLQVAAYANYLDFGLQTAVARYLAGALELRDYRRCSQVLSTAVAILSIAGGVAFLGLGIIAWQLPHLFRSVPHGLAGEIGIGVAILAVSAAVGLPLSAYSGVLIAMQRNEFPAITIGLSRILGAIAVVLTVRHTTSLMWLSACVGGFNLLGSFIQYCIAKNLLPDVRFSIDSILRTTTSELVRYCATLSVWSFSMLLVSGLDVTIVGLFRFSATGAYSIATTLILFFTGLIGAAYSAMLAPLAVLQARNEYSRISGLILTTTRLNSYFSIGVIVVTFLFGETLVRTWVGPGYLAVTLPVLKILLVAQAIRLVGSAYGTALISLGMQSYGLVSVLIEGFANLILSLLGVIWFGPVGVAWATLIAAAIAVTVTILWVIPQTHEVRIDVRSFVSHGIILPLTCLIPFLLWLVLRAWYRRTIQIGGEVLPVAIVLLLTTILVYRGVVSTQRVKS